jgi:hypothetical protein
MKRILLAIVSGYIMYVLASFAIQLGFVLLSVFKLYPAIFNTEIDLLLFKTNIVLLVTNVFAIIIAVYSFYATLKSKRLFNKIAPNK